MEKEATCKARNHQDEQEGPSSQQLSLNDSLDSPFLWKALGVAHTYFQ